MVATFKKSSTPCRSVILPRVYYSGAAIARGRNKREFLDTSCDICYLRRHVVVSPNEKPVITKHEKTSTGKCNLQGIAARKVRTAIEGVAIDKLVQQYGSPLFVYSEKTLRRQIRQVCNTIAYKNQNHVDSSSERLNQGGIVSFHRSSKATYSLPDTDDLSIDNYVEQIYDALYASLRLGDPPPLIPESNRSIIDGAGYLITTVVALKYLPDGTRAYIVDVGVPRLLTSLWNQYHVQTDCELSGAGEPSIVYGSLCMNVDVLDAGIPLPPLKRGQHLIFSPVGAYNNTQWMQFIHNHPNVVLVGSNGEAELIREAARS